MFFGPRHRRHIAVLIVALMFTAGTTAVAHADARIAMPGALTVPVAYARTPSVDPVKSPVIGTTTTTARYIDEHGWPIAGLKAEVYRFTAVWSKATRTWEPTFGSKVFTSDAKGVLRVSIPVFNETTYKNFESYHNVVHDISLSDSAYVFDVPDRNVNRGTIRLRSVNNSKAYSKRIKTSSKTAVRKAYRIRYEAKVRYEKAPKVRGCTVAATSKGTQKRTRDAVNYMRAMSGLTPVTFPKRLATKARRAALVQHSLGYLDHYPAKAKCKNKTGIKASGESNLSYGPRGAANIAQYMADGGAHNAAVGHRRWILDPAQTQMGVGYAGSFGALYVLAPGRASNPNPWMTPWPSAGYFPAELEPSGRWNVTFNRPDLNFSRAKVRVTGGGKTKTAKIVYRDGIGAGSGVQSGITFEVPASTRKVTKSKARTVTVKVSGITVRGKHKLAPVTYKVKLFKAGKGK